MCLVYISERYRGGNHFPLDLVERRRNVKPWQIQKHAIQPKSATKVMRVAIRVVNKVEAYSVSSPRRRNLKAKVILWKRIKCFPFIPPRWNLYSQQSLVTLANHRTLRKSAIFPQPSNQKQLKWSHTAYVNKWSFAFKIKLCVFQVTKA